MKKLAILISCFLACVFSSCSLLSSAESKTDIYYETGYYYEGYVDGYTDAQAEIFTRILNATHFEDNHLLVFEEHIASTEDFDLFFFSSVHEGKIFLTYDLTLHNYKISDALNSELLFFYLFGYDEQEKYVPLMKEEDWYMYAVLEEGSADILESNHARGTIPLHLKEGDFWATFALIIIDGRYYIVECNAF